MIKEPMFISPRTFKGYEQYKTDCARASGWNEAMAFIFAEELETERSRTIREKFFVVENVQKVKQSEIQRLIDDTADTPQTEETCGRCVYVRGSQWCQGCNGTPKRWDGEKIVDTPQTGSTGSPIGDYRDGVGAWSDCPWK